mmetsp:Transcript_20326/g.51993  ORF Transcript_20326/g.51993 Transcript_20326/m.51993 type:complete len:249 (+) Transcript_20326:466-1212(+)
MPNAREIGVGAISHLISCRGGAKRFGVFGVLPPWLQGLPWRLLLRERCCSGLPASGMGRLNFIFGDSASKTGAGGWATCWERDAACTAAWNRLPACAKGAPPLGCDARAAALKRDLSSAPLEISIGAAWCCAAPWAATSDGTCCATWKGPKSTSGAHWPGPWVNTNLPLQPSRLTTDRMERNSSLGARPVDCQFEIARSMSGRTTRSRPCWGMCCISFTNRIAVVLLFGGTIAFVSAIYSSTVALPRK